MSDEQRDQGIPTDEKSVANEVCSMKEIPERNLKKVATNYIEIMTHVEMTHYMYDFKIVYFSHESEETMRRRVKDSLIETGYKTFIMYCQLNKATPELIDEYQCLEEKLELLQSENTKLREALKAHCECYRHVVKTGQIECTACKQLAALDKEGNDE